jgi:receptor protein-tyrosine kinase
MVAEGKGPSSPQVRRIEERIQRIEEFSGPAMLRNHTAAHQTAHIDLSQLQESGIPTPQGGRARVVDEYRIIKRTILSNAAPGTRRNVVMVTSAQPGEGKTFTALSLAMSVVAEENVHVLLVDLDVVKQDVCRRLSIEAEIGLVDLLADSTLTLAQVLVQTDVPRLTVLPAGLDRPLAHELMASPKMQTLMDYLSDRYRNGLVIIDVAPVLATADASLLAANVGQVLLVVEANRTRRSSVEQTLSLLKECSTISLVLNKVEASELIDQYGSYYGNYYGAYTHTKPKQITHAKPSEVARTKPNEVQSLTDRVTAYLRNRLLRSNRPK